MQEGPILKHRMLIVYITCICLVLYTGFNLVAKSNYIINMHTKGVIAGQEMARYQLKQDLDYLINEDCGDRDGFFKICAGNHCSYAKLYCLEHFQP